MLIRIALLAVCFVSLLSLQSRAEEAGVGHGGGGDATSAEFVATGHQVLSHLTLNPISGVDASTLKKAIASTKVESVQEPLLLGGVPKDAINYPEAKRIVLCAECWARIRSDRFAAWTLVLHEYLGILGIDDRNYQLSHQLDSAGVCLRTPGVRLAIEKAVGVDCLRIIREDLEKIESIGFVVGDSLKAGDLKHLNRVSMMSIEARETPLQVLPLGLFDELPRLVTLYVSGVAKLTSENFKGLQRRLKSFSVNGIKSDAQIADGAFADIRAEFLSLKGAWAQNPKGAGVLHAGIFRNTSIRGLAMSHFLLPEHVERDLFQGLIGVSALYLMDTLGDSKSSYFPTYAADALADFKGLTELDLGIDLESKPIEVLKNVDGSQLNRLILRGVGFQGLRWPQIQHLVGLKEIRVESRDQSLSEDLYFDLNDAGFGCQFELEYLTCTRP